jgi:hypothetical protein
MRDPYQVLGISPEASDDEVKKAYREQAKKYHPDNYANTEFSDIAGEKMKEINEAYDRILQMRAGGGQTSSSSYTGADFARIRQLISIGRVGEAEVMLEGMRDRPAEWHYLRGLCAVQNRNYHEASGFFATACEMDPSNREYSTMYNRFRGAQQSYGSYGQGGTYRECNTCDICSSLMCADCCCECCGGDLIACC